MFESVCVNSIDLIDIEVQFGCLPRDSIGNLFQFGMAASDHGASTCALWRAIIVTKATLRVVPCKKERKKKLSPKERKPINTRKLFKQCAQREFSRISPTLLLRKFRKTLEL